MQADRDFQTVFAAPSNPDATSIEINPFRTAIESALVDVDTALETKTWDEARQAADRAQTTWDNWRKGKPNWLRLLKYKRDELDTRFNKDLSVAIPYGKGVQNDLESAVNQMAAQTPEQFKATLEDIRQQFDRYLQGQQLLKQLGELERSVPEPRRTVWRSQLARLQNNLDYLLPSDREGFQSWQTEAKQALDGLSNELAPPNQASAEAAAELSVRSIQLRQFIAPLQTIPLLQAIQGSQRPEGAADRLSWYQWTGRLVAIGFLAGIGFNQLYLQNPIFGANGFGDYFSLLAWGFGAEVTRESATKVLQSLRLPESK